MDDQIKQWITGFTCGPCRTEVGSERRAGVLVLVQEPAHDPEVIPFCYKHAGIYVSRWAEPAKAAGIRDALSELGRAAGALGRTLLSAVHRQLPRL